MASNIVKTTDHINRQFIERTDTVNTVRMDSVRVKTLPDTVKIISGNSSNILIVNHSVYGEVGSYPVYFPLVLGHPEYGILGVGYLYNSSAYDSSISRVINRSNVFVERFVHTDFVDNSITTASVVSEVGVSFSTGQIFQSECFAKNDVVYSSYSYNLEGVSVDNLSISTINNGVDGLKVLFTASAPCSLSKYTVVYG